MKKTGFTLIEVICSIFILMIIFSTVVSMGHYGKRVISDIKIKSCVYEIQNIFTYSKSYCKENNKYGKIVIDYEKNQVYFKINNNDILKKVCINQYGRLIEATSNAGNFSGWQRKIDVTDKGKIKTGLTLHILEEDNSSKYAISIGVGVDYINIKKEDI